MATPAPHPSPPVNRIARSAVGAQPRPRSYRRFQTTLRKKGSAAAGSSLRLAARPNRSHPTARGLRKNSRPCARKTGRRRTSCLLSSHCEPRFAIAVHDVSHVAEASTRRPAAAIIAVEASLYHVTTHGFSCSTAMSSTPCPHAVRLLRNQAVSAAVDARPRTALRCGKRPKRDTSA